MNKITITMPDGSTRTEQSYYPFWILYDAFCEDDAPAREWTDSVNCFYLSGYMPLGEILENLDG